MARCLVTGANGFVGSNLANTLRAAHWDVRGLVRRPEHASRLRAADIAPVEGSLDDVDALDAAVRGVDAVFHVAGRTKAISWRDYQRDNVEGTRHVVQAALKQTTPPLVVFVSSLAASGPSTQKSPRTEVDLPRPISAYGRSKLGAEQAIADLAAELPASIVRPPVIFGPADKASLALYRGMKVLPIHPAPGWRQLPISIVYINDLCQAILSVAERGERITNKEPAQGTYHIAGERSITYGEMGRLAAAAAGWAVAVIPVPRIVFWGIAAVGETIGRLRRQPALVNWDKAREATASGWLCDDAKIRRHLGYRPSGTLEEQFAETVAWYRAERWI